MADAAELKAGSVVASGKRLFIVVGLDAEKAEAILLRTGPLEQLRSHVVPAADDIRLSGLVRRALVACCDGVRRLPRDGLLIVGAVNPCLLTRIRITLQRVRAAEASEAGPAARTTIWRPPGGDRGRRIGMANAC